LHLVLASLHWLVRILGSIVLVGDQHLWCEALLFEQLAHKLDGCELVAPSLHQQIENLAFTTVCVTMPPTRRPSLVGNRTGYILRERTARTPNALG
jgi:hypothetical protein